MSTTDELSPSTIEFVRETYKGSDKTLGEIVTQAEQYENELNAFIDGLEAMEEER